MTRRSALAAVFASAGQPLDLREYPVFEPRPKDARLSLRRSGICGTDIHAAYLEFLRRAPDLQKRLARAISHRFAVSDANRAIGEAEQGHSIKGCFVPCLQ
jgi:Zn-dependent alcohol dehydrogenase